MAAQVSGSARGQCVAKERAPTHQSAIEHGRPAAEAKTAGQCRLGCRDAGSDAVVHDRPYAHELRTRKQSYVKDLDVDVAR